ncbi:hypothetical protein HNY73_000039 [Argiope bruennichi]|uniref:Reverse transcriptase domain-containing protein n=1 Tax=Argiope bruennichi TaxID=94029 RepID=A0A8T0G143_ARGBR|nr:hypothetical protein HNY73_000039 [Argiope bruennichi]
MRPNDIAQCEIYTDDAERSFFKARKFVTAAAPIKLSESFILVPSMFDWILCGSRIHTTIIENTSVHHISVQDSTDCLNDKIRCLWELNSIGIQGTQKRKMTIRDEEILSLSEFYKLKTIEEWFLCLGNQQLHFCQITKLLLKQSSIFFDEDLPLLLPHENGRNVTRFLWYKLENDSSEIATFADEITEYRFTCLPFGLTCFRFLLSAAIRELASNHQKEFPIAAPMIDKNMYMDDFLGSVEYESWITILYYENENFMSLMKLPMDKWTTNSLKLKDVLQTHEKHYRTDTIILGIDWNTFDDSLGNGFKTSFCIYRDKPLTKRWLLPVLLASMIP